MNQFEDTFSLKKRFTQWYQTTSSNISICCWWTLFVCNKMAHAALSKTGRRRETTGVWGMFDDILTEIMEVIPVGGEDQTMVDVTIEWGCWRTGACNTRISRLLGIKYCPYSIIFSETCEKVGCYTIWFGYWWWWWWWSSSSSAAASPHLETNCGSKLRKQPKHVTKATMI